MHAGKILKFLTGKYAVVQFNQDSVGVYLAVLMNFYLVQTH